MSFVPISVTFDKSTRLWNNFIKYHDQHPHIYENYKEDILKAIKEGRDLYSISIITEHERWEKKYKINNTHRTYYARLFVEEFPQYKNFFRFRAISNV